MKTLFDVLPYEAREFDTVQKYANIEVTREVDGCEEMWPGTHKNVLNWYVLANGKAIGWNESSCRGWAFPVITYKE